MPGISVSKMCVPFGGGGVDWSTYWKTLSLFFLDGTIIEDGGNYYFKDASTNGRNFLITGYDFAADWTAGFPYKSAATISAPAADAALIAADINNFLYDAGGTPNAIPVVSLFQDIDYEHVIFCKHEAQVVDGNGVETYEPRVSAVYMATAALTGDDLTKAYTDFGVTEESAAALWVMPTGNDITGDGTKVAPYVTLDKAVDTINGGETIYAKTNVYAGDATSVYLYNEKQNSLVGIGGVKLVTAAAAYAFRIRYDTKPLLQRMSIVPSGNLTNSAVYPLACPAIEFKDLLINATATSAISLFFKRLLNSILLGTYSTYTINFGVTTGDVTIENNYINATSPSFIVGSNITGIITVKNNKIKGTYTGATGYAIWSVNNANTQFIVTGNYFDIIGVRVYQKTTDALATTFSYNTVILRSTLTSFAINIATSYNANQIVGNTFIDTDNYGSLRIVNLSNAKANIASNLFNIVDTEKTDGAEIYFGKTNATVIDTVVAASNKIISKRSAGYNIGIGEESSTDGDETITLPIIEKNKIEGAALNGIEYALIGVHGTFISFQKDGHIRYNHVEGCGYGAIVKGSGTTYTSGGIYYNIIKTNDVFGAYVKGCDGVNVLNNTIIVEHHIPAAAIGLYANTGGDDADNCVVKNNIVIYTGTGTFTAIAMEGGTSNVIDYNIYYCPNGTLRFTAAGSNYTFAEWQVLGYDANSIVLSEAQFNALFVDFAAGDYSLPIGSAAIGAGEALAAAYDDGLDASTDWGSDTEVPVVVTKQQGAAWDCGAYIH